MKKDLRVSSLDASDAGRAFQRSDSDADERPPSSVPAHTVQFYEDEAFLIESVSIFVNEGLHAKDHIVLFITPQHRQALEQKLQEALPRTGPAVGVSDIRYLDARETLAKCLINDWPEEQVFMPMMHSLLQSAAADRPLRIFGELVALLWADHKHRAALRLEELWNELLRQRPFRLLCAYSITGFPTQDLSESYREICALHSQTRPTDLAA